MFKVATVSLKWSVRDFWYSTPREFWAAVEGSEEAVKRLEDMRRQSGG
jgi:hypothetical protein